MKEIMGVTYLSDKEAACRYGYSQSWFRFCRSKKKGPKFVRLQGRGKALYPITETDEWFKRNILEEAC